jgi:two-component system, OmpR family, sensor histidine kinase CiaH
MKKIYNIKIVFAIYWVLLAYIIAALIWWFMALNNQSKQMSDIKLLQLQKNTPQYQQQATEIKAKEHRKTIQYIGEGVTFLLLIAAGAAYIYNAVKKQFAFAKEQQAFMMALTHELKTPIAVTSLNLETLQKHTLQKEQQQKLIATALLETQRLNTLCNNMLIASQLENANYTINKEPINVNLEIEKAINTYANRYPNVIFNTTLQPNSTLQLDVLLFQLVISNLIDNAIKYNNKQVSITISTQVQPQYLQLTIADNGKGINPADKQMVFKKYYKTGNAATKSAKGTGLGLYLIKQIVQAHKGDIILTDNTPQGAIFTVKFPN